MGGVKHMVHRMRLLTVAAAFLAGPVAAQEGYDCIIEPSVVVSVGSAVDGVISEVLPERGAVVSKGDIVARLESSVEEASLRMAEANAASTVDIEIARSRIDEVQAELDRQSQLASRQVVAQAVLETKRRELDQALLELGRAEQNRELAALDRDRAAAQLSRRVIRSPIDGIMLRRLIGPGEYVYSQVQIAEIATLDPLYVDVFLPAEVYDRVAVGKTVTVEPAAPIGGAYRAEFTAIDRVFDAASDTFGARLTLPNPDLELPAGVDCRVYIE